MRDCDCYWGCAVNLVTSFGFRAGLMVSSHLFALVLFIASGRWTALMWLIVASAWALLAFRWEHLAEVQKKNANSWRDLYEKRAGRVS